MNLRLTAIGLAAALCSIAVLSGTASAQSWPNKPVRFVVPFPPGGTTDILARSIAPKLSERLGQQFVIDNRGGAGGNVGAEIVAKAPADGYTILMGTPGTQAINQYVYKTMPYDTEKGFVNLSLVARIANVMAVHPSVPAKDLAEFIKYAKEKPGQLNYATPGNGSTGHLSTELFKTMTGTNLVHVPYKGSGPALNDLLAGQVQLTIDNLPSALPHIKAGTLRALGVTTEKRWFATPDIPAIAEVVPGYEASSWFVVAAPAAIPKDIATKLSSEIDAILKTPEMMQHFKDIGAEPVGGTPEQTQAFVKAEMGKWEKVVQVSGAKVD